MKLQMCRARRRSKGDAATVTRPGDDIYVDESENELVVEGDAKDNKVKKECVMKEISVETMAGEDDLDGGDVDAFTEEHMSQGTEFPDEAPQLEKEDEEGEEGEEGGEGNHEELATLDAGKVGGDAEALLKMLEGMSLTPLKLGQGFTRDFGTLQGYCRSKLYDLMNDREVSLRCVRDIVPAMAQKCLAASVECKVFPPLVRGCLGIQDKAEKEEQQNNEFRVEDEERVMKDMPTLPTGMWVVDSINEALDTWTDAGTSQAMGTLFKLLNFTALLTYFGDSSGDKIATFLSRTSTMVSRGPEGWREVLRPFTSDSYGDDRPLPDIPNATFPSMCETKLDDVPDIDTVQCGDGAFRVYWAYTEKWIRKRYGPSIVESKQLFEHTRRWFNSLEGFSQDLFIRLSRTLCCVGK